ncbi:MAG: hypothetical protein HY873_05240 [Chloroflexi bacterium]|nr:hypothetical protein [Chloroflexota bacterium]
MAIESTATHEPADRNRPRAWARPSPGVWLGALVGVAGVASRFWHLGSKNLWLDEVWSWRAANMPLPDMVDWTQQDIHPPLYYGLLHYWVLGFGNSEADLRALSALAGGLTILLLVAISFRIEGALLSAAAGLALVLNAPHIYISQEARMYSLEGFLALSSSVALGTALRRGASLPWFAAYALLATALAYTHYTGLLLIGLQGVIGAGFAMRSLRREQGWRLPLLVAISFGFVGLAFVPWLPTFVDHVHRGAGDGHVPDPTLDYVIGVWRSAFALDRARDAWLAVALPVAILGSYGVLSRWRDPLVLCVTAVAVVPAAELAFSLYNEPVFDLKRVAPFTPGLAFIFGLAVVEFRRYLRTVLDLPSAAASALGALAILVAVLVMSVAASDQYRVDPPENWRAVSQHIEESHAGTAFVYKGYLTAHLSYYLGEGTPLVPLSHEQIALARTGQPPISLTTNDVVLLVLGRVTDVDQQRIVTSLGPYFTVSEAWTADERIWVYALQARVAAP